MTAEELIRATMLAHEHEAPNANRLVVSVPDRMRAGRWGWGAAAWAACLILIAGLAATVGLRHERPHAAPPATPTGTKSATSALECPGQPGHMSGTSPWVPANPHGVDGHTQLAPRQAPARVVVCAYIGPGSPAGVSGSVVLTGDLAGVASDLSWAPPAIPGHGRPCALNLLPTDGDYYLIGLNYPTGTLWVAAPANHCAGASNGLFTSDAHAAALAIAWRKAGRWVPRPATDRDACNPTGFGRLGQQTAMVPDQPISVTTCEATAPNGGRSTRRTTTSGYQQLTTALNQLPTGPWGHGCNPGTQPVSMYNLLFDYAEGPPVVVTISPNCTPAVSNRSLQSSDASKVLPLLDQLLRKGGSD
jgi:hypothetical protein